MWPVAEPIHQSQRYVIHEVFVQMILEQHERTTDPCRFPQQNRRVLRMVQHVHEKADVECAVRKRKRSSIKGMALDFAFRPYQELDTLNRNVRAKLRDQTPDGAVPATNIQHACALRNLRRKHFGKHAGTPLKYQSMVPARNPREWPGGRPGSLGWGSHLFQIVVADECPPADAQHAEEKGSENHLQAKE